MKRALFLFAVFSSCRVADARFSLLRWFLGLTPLDRLFGFTLAPRARCMISFLSYGFDGSEERFEEYYRDDSVFVVAQTGAYKGLTGITEYTRFTNPEYSPFFLDSTALNADYEFELNFVEYDRDGNCVFTALVESRAVLNPEFAKGSTYDAVTLTRIYYNLKEQYFPKTHFFLPVKLAQFSFDSYVTDASRGYVCDTLRNECAEYLDPGTDNSNCETELALLPIVEGDDAYVDGNSQGCRMLHSVLARQNPELHCAHVSLNTTDKDPNDNLKCAASEGLLTNDLFSEADIASYRAFCEKVDIDPDIGYDVVS